MAAFVLFRAPAVGTVDRVTDRTETDNKWLRTRRLIALNPVLNTTYRIVVGIVGTLVLAVGVVAIPYPGPGWLIVFAGLAILGSEFQWAYRMLHAVKARYDVFVAWFARQSIVVKALSALATTVIVVVTLWVLGTADLVAGWFGVEHPFPPSPL